MEWLLWVIVIVLVIAIVWWFLNRRSQDRTTGAERTEASRAPFGEGPEGQPRLAEPPAAESAAAPQAPAAVVPPATPAAQTTPPPEQAPAGAHRTAPAADVDDWEEETTSPAEATTSQPRETAHAIDVDDWEDDTATALHERDAANLDAGAVETAPPLEAGPPLETGRAGVPSPVETGPDTDRPSAYSVQAAEPAPRDTVPAAGTEQAEQAPYGEGSAAAVADGSAPAGFSVKGVEDGMYYFEDDHPAYGQTEADVWFLSDAHAEAAGFRRARSTQARAASGPAFSFSAPVAPGPYGEGSADPKPDGSGPAGFMIKGDEDAMVYHAPSSPGYAQSAADVWFRSPEDAEAAGFRDGGA